MSVQQQQQEAVPYNNQNKLVDEAYINKTLTDYGVNVSIKNMALYRTAFVHRSYCTRKNENFVNGNTNCPDDCLPLQEESNERLEFLGDAVINLIVARYLFARYPDENEGFLTKIRTKLVNGTMLASFGEQIELNRFIQISKQIEENNGRLNKKILEDCFEAFVGAMFLDNEPNGYDVAETWLITLIEETIDFSELVMSNNNYKDVFLKFYQHTHNFLPRFFEMNSENTIKGKIYHVCVKDQNNCIISTGSGPSKKHAENDCAKNALTYLGQMP